MKFVFYFSLIPLFAFQNPAKGKKANKTINDSVFVAGDVVKLPLIPFYTCIKGNEYHYETKDSLNIIADFLLRNPKLSVEFSVHTDLRGSTAANENLSQLTAKSYVYYFIYEKKIDSSRVIPRGYGEWEPIISQDEINKAKTKEEFERLSALNRRNELRVLKVD